MPVTTICLFSSNFLLILKCYNNVFPVCHIFKHTLDYFLCILVGYIADFICYVANDVVQIQMNLPLRILALLLAQLMASMGVALYMVADMGIAPYDSVAIINACFNGPLIQFFKTKLEIFLLKNLRITILQFFKAHIYNGYGPFISTTTFPHRLSTQR